MAAIASCSPTPKRSSATSRVDYVRISSSGEPSATISPLSITTRRSRELLGLVHVVRGQHDGHALLLEPEQPVPHDVPGLRVEPGRRLVEQQHLGPVDQRAGDGQPALHAAGEVLDLGLRLLGELHELEQLVDALAHLGARDPEVAAVDVEVVAHVELGVEGVLLRAHPDAARGSRARRWPGRGRGSAASPPLTGETAAIIRIVEDLPAPLGPRKPNDSPRRTSTSMPLHRLDGALLALERLAQPDGPDHRLGGGRGHDDTT